MTSEQTVSVSPIWHLGHFRKGTDAKGPHDLKISGLFVGVDPPPVNNHGAGWVRYDPGDEYRIYPRVRHTFKPKN